MVNFDQSTLNKLLNFFEPKHFDKGYHYAKVGEYSTRMDFVKKGILRAYHRNEEGDNYN